MGFQGATTWASNFSLFAVSADFASYTTTPIAVDVNVQVPALSIMCANNAYGRYNGIYLQTLLNLPNVYAAPLVAGSNYCMKLSNTVVLFPGLSSTQYTSAAAFGNGLVTPTAARGTRTLNANGVSAAATTYFIGAYFA